MYRILRAILNSTWLLSPLTILQDPLIPQEAKPPEKSILIVGGGSAGLAALKTLFDLPERTRGNWEILLYEQRDDVGGIW
jgi:ribulose 1,5-bisphosphate synthetase/thiazole synthase